ncbi:MAG: lysylphosphatidylglycerol synthase transmembrane domain-containing protein [bacterium]
MNLNKKLILRFSVSILLITLLLKQVSLKEVIDNVRHANYLILFVLVAFFINYFFSAYRWRELIIYKTKSKVSILYLLKLYYIGSFLSNFLPSTIGGDVYKAYKLGKDTENMAGALAATFMERLVGVVSLSLISSVSLIVFLGLKGVVVFVGFWLLIVMGFLGLGFLSKFSKKLKKFNDSIIYYKNNKKALLKALFYSLFVQIGSVLSQFFTVLSLGIKLPLAFAFFAFPVIGFISFLPISISGLGVQDNMYVFVLGKVEISAALAGSASILFHVLRAFNSLIGWALLSFDKGFKDSLSLDFKNEKNR